MAERRTPAKRLPLKNGKLQMPENPGEYCGPVKGYTGDKPAVLFLLPTARDEGASGPQRAVHHVTSPPHTFRECADGSLEIRESILSRGRDNVEIWHGYLDEGNVWREI